MLRSPFQVWTWLAVDWLMVLRKAVSSFYRFPWFSSTTMIAFTIEFSCSKFKDAAYQFRYVLRFRKNEILKFNLCIVD
jgi:hypothetical protein